MTTSINSQIDEIIKAAEGLIARENRWAVYLTMALVREDARLINFALGRIVSEYGLQDMAARTGIAESLLAEFAQRSEPPSVITVKAIAKVAGLDLVAQPARLVPINLLAD
ncbi:hypothetical protein K2O51_23480 [Cupriavidus pinatubonensis]|uniref:hypothetical protein n=1 Tax=Cupriavidus pinatubonensis TaxID=248026 RepID=UPI001C735C7E|nr:hypothetical protein [Cupriavidus pinatubonensis]QYY30334.1 hypothetical protein K2O51_23480 [Cupriavidus pinatubonensis]